jgi:hypothetical protein
MVMNRPPGEILHNAEGIDRLSTSFGMHPIVGEPIRRGHMQPVQFPQHPQTRFIQVQHLRGFQLRLDRCRRWSPPRSNSDPAFNTIASEIRCPNRSSKS